MSGLFHRIAILREYLAASVRSQLQYRASAVMLAIGHMITTGIEFVAIWALFDRFGQIEGWTLAEIAVLYGLASVSFAFAEAFGRGFSNFGAQVKSGDFDRVLLRPLGTALQVGAAEVQLLRIGRCLQGAIVFVWGIAALDVAWGPAHLALFAVALVSAFCIFLGIFVLQATLAFWTVESLEIFATITYGGVETTQFPLTIYDRWLRWLFIAVVPLGCATYFPALALLGRADPLGAPAWVSWCAPAIGPLFLVVALRIWEVGVRHYRSTGS
jgi:ABC-2 type transport system permease protein